MEVKGLGGARKHAFVRFVGKKELWHILEGEINGEKYLG
jgi:hypothetical protein